MLRTYIAAIFFFLNGLLTLGTALNLTYIQQTTVQNLTLAFV